MRHLLLAQPLKNLQLQMEGLNLHLDELKAKVGKNKDPGSKWKAIANGY